MRRDHLSYLVLTNIPHREWAHSIDGSRQLIGRALDADIRIPYWFAGVSRRHAEVWADACNCLIRDVGSSQGTHVNGVWIDHVSRAGIVQGDLIWLGAAELEVVAELSRWPRRPGEPATRPARLRPTREMPTMTESVQPLFHRLTPAEIDLLVWFSRGYESADELAQLLGRRPSTVLTELATVFKKFGVHTRSQLMGLIQ